MTIFFQEVDPAQLDLSRDADTIIERTLRFGNRSELRWLFACYGQPRITTWVRDKSSMTPLTHPRWETITPIMRDLPGSIPGPRPGCPGGLFGWCPFRSQVYLRETH